MSTTDTLVNTLKILLNEANPQKVEDILRKIRLGDVLSPIKVVATGLDAAAAFDITTAAFLAKCTVTGITLDDEQNLPAIGTMKTLRLVTAGTGEAGPKIVTDAGGTAVNKGAGGSVGVALLSDDGKTITFDGTCTAFTFEYMPRSSTDLSDPYPALPTK